MSDPEQHPDQSHGYDVPFVWDSSHGHMVELLVQHVQPGLLVDVGCGYAPHAEHLAERGFELIGLDLDPAAVADLRGRGFTSDIADLADPSALVNTIEQVTAGREVRAVLAMDVLEHLASPHETLAALTVWMRARSVDALGISLPNVSHQDVAVKLLGGRWDLTPTGLLDHTHLRFFTERSVDVLTRSAGLDELARHDVKSAKSDQYWPDHHPLVSDASQLGIFARTVRRRADEHGDTFQFVRLYQRSGDPGPTPTLLDMGQHHTETTVGLSVILPEGGSVERAQLITALATQTSTDFEVVSGDEPIDELVARCAGTSVVVVGSEVSFDDAWVEQFVAAAERHPGAVLRCGARIGDQDRDGPGGFDIVGHLLQNSTPSASVALPRSLLSEFGLGFEPSDPDGGRYALLVEAATLVGVAETGAVAVTVSPDWHTVSAASAGEHATEVRRRLDRSPWLMPVGAAEHLARLMADRQQLDRRVAELEAEAKVLNADIAWLNAELDVLPVRAVRRLMRRRPRRRG